MYVHSFSGNYLLEFRVGVVNHQCREGVGHRGRVWYRWWVPIGPPCILFLCQHVSARNCRLQFWLGVANPQSWGRGGHRGLGMAPFERALVSFYRSSIVTFPLYIYAFQRYCHFCSPERHFFPIPLLVSPKISPCSPGSRWITFWLQRAKDVGLIVCAINFQDFQPMWSQSTNVTDKTDGRHAIARPRFALKCIAR